MSYASEIKLYRQAIDTLEALGLRRSVFVNKSQGRLKAQLKAALASFDIDANTKAILSTDANWSLAAAIIADCEEIIDADFLPEGREWIVDLKDRAYKAGSVHAESMALEGGRKVFHRGYDATTLQAIRQAVNLNAASAPAFLLEARQGAVARPLRGKHLATGGYGVGDRSC